MEQTKIKCKKCGEFLHDARGIGDDKPLLVCINGGCVSNTGVIRCPKCGSTKNRVIIPGIGEQTYHCNNCRMQFDQ